MQFHFHTNQRFVAELKPNVDSLHLVCRDLVKQNLQLVKENIDSIFGKELERQEKLGEWF